MKQTKQELRARISDLEELNGIAVRAKVAAEIERDRAREDAEQARGSAKLAQLNFDEERADVRVRLECLAEIERMVFEATRQPLNERRTLIEALREIIEHRAVLVDSIADANRGHYAIGELAKLIEPRWDEAHPGKRRPELRTQLAHLFARWDDERDHARRQAERLSERSTLTAMIQSVYGTAFGELAVWGSDVTPKTMLGQIERELQRLRELPRTQQLNDSLRASENVVKRQRKALEQIIEIAQGETL